MKCRLFLFRVRSSVGENCHVILHCSTVNLKNSDSIRLLIALAIAALGVAVVTGGLIFSSDGGVLRLALQSLASCAWVVYVARLIDRVRAAYVRRLTPHRRHLAVAHDSHSVRASALTRQVPNKSVEDELGEPVRGMRGLARQDVPPPLPSV